MQSVFEILEWPKVLEHLESYCQTGYGRLLVNNNHLFLKDAAAITRMMALVEEAKSQVQRFHPPSLEEPEDILHSLKRIKKAGVFNSAREMGRVLITLKQLRELARYFVQHRSKSERPHLADFIEDLTLPNPVIEYLETLVDDNGDLRDSASETYGKLRKQFHETQLRLEEQMRGMIHKYPFSKYLQEPVITQRDGRYVLPVKVEHKGDVKGIVHGASSSGATVFVEPQSTVDANNRLSELQGKIKEEVRRILAEASETLQPDVEAVEDFIQKVAELDLLVAKAQQSLKFDANPVSIDDKPGAINLKQARHPLLLLQPDPVVPNDIALSAPHRVMLITGPNTGGKTVILKLVGLCALMMKAGLHLPVKTGSSMTLFDPVLADIGDPQDIAQNLSTFSGHMNRLKGFIDEPELGQALILIDEICAGTDPQAGAVLAESLLGYFYDQGATVMVTTHIGALKVSAHNHVGYINASVEFDAESLSPTYRLIIGVPGGSNALNIARRLGIPDAIIQDAQAKITQPTSDSASLIESLETKNLALTEELEQAMKLKDEIAWEEKQMRDQLNRIEGSKRQTIEMYKESLKDKLRFIEQEVNTLRKELKKAQETNPKKVDRYARKFRKLQSETTELFAEETQKLFPNPDINWESLEVGDIVESRSLNLSGAIVEKNDAKQEVIIQAGILKTKVPLDDITRKTGKKQAPKEPTKGRGGSRVITERKKPSVECDVRGMTSEDAIGVLEKFLDDALLQEAPTVGVIHGLGTGTLKKAIRSYLRELPYVKGFHPAEASDGGDGKTVIDL